MNIYLQKGEQKHGPLSEDQIRRGIDAGVIGPSDLACTSDNESWRPLSDLLDSKNSQKSSTNRWMIVLRVLFWNRRPWTRGDWIGMSVILGILLIFGIVMLAMDAHFARQKEGTTELDKIYARAESQSMSSDANGKLVFPPFTPSHTTQYPSSFLPRATPFGVSTLPASIPPTPGLWSSEEDFKQRYGEPLEILHNPPLEPDVFVYKISGFTMNVTFWNGAAQLIGIARIDGRPLTEGTIDERLDALASKQDWNREKDESGNVINVWASNDAIASLSPYSDEEPKTDCLRIWTKNFFREYARLRGPK